MNKLNKRYTLHTPCSDLTCEHSLMTVGVAVVPVLLVTTHSSSVRVADRIVLLRLVQQLPCRILRGASGRLVEHKILPSVVIPLKVDGRRVWHLRQVVFGVPALAFAMIGHVVEGALVALAE